MLFDDEEIGDADDLTPSEKDKLKGWLVVPAPLAPGQLVEAEATYRRQGRPQILFVELDDDGGEVLGNPGHIATYLGVSAIGLTVERAERLLTDRWARG